MFHFDRGLKLTSSDLAIDFRRRQPRAFVSHAHADHMARHELAICTPHTGRLYQLRFGQRQTRELPYRQSIQWGPVKLTTYPAGHCLGSAMLLAEEAGQRLLYTGDFKLSESATAERAELPRADILVMETTYGNPTYRHTPRKQAVERLINLVLETLAAGRTPVIEAYVLGKSQEVTKILTLAGIPVLQHPKVFEVSQVYRACGVDLGDMHLYPREHLPGHAVVVPPRFQRAGLLPKIGRPVTFAVTGWAMHPATQRRLSVDHAIPLSDHADFDELLEAAQRVQPEVIYCTHGPGGFAEHLRAAGFRALALDPAERTPADLDAMQRRLPFAVEHTA